MTAPVHSALMLLWALGIGAALGLFYDFLLPLRRRCTALADLLFVGAVFWGWIILAFGLCAGDPRLGCTAGLALGFFLWRKTVGRLLRPVILLFWRGVALVFLPAKKILGFFCHFYKNLLAFLKRWVIMKLIPIFTGGAGHEVQKQSQPQSGGAENKPRHQSRRGGRRRPVHSGVGRTVQLHRSGSESV